MSDEKAKTLFGKLAEVMGAVNRVAKHGRNDFHKYDYATEADIVEAVRGELSARKVVLIPSIAEWTQNGTLTALSVDFTFIDGESGESHTSRWLGMGDDKGDKGAYKAMTGATKYFLLKTFLIPTGDDPEGDTGTDAKARDSEPEKRSMSSRHGGKAAAAKSASGLMNDGQKNAIERLMLEKRNIAPVDIPTVIPDWPHISSVDAGLHIAQLQK